MLKKEVYGFRKLLHNGFEIGIFAKGVHGVLEIIGGILLIFITPDRLNRIIHLFVQHEQFEDAHDFLANILIRSGYEFTSSFQLFGVLYLLSHGVVKVFLVGLLWKRKLWAYPLTEVFLFAFVAYQMYRYSYNHSILMIALSVVDLAMMVLTWIEYKRLKIELC
jgi:uncharacterized membrane protein